MKFGIGVVSSLGRNQLRCQIICNWFRRFDSVNGQISPISIDDLHWLAVECSVTAHLWYINRCSKQPCVRHDKHNECFLYSGKILIHYPFKLFGK